MSACNNGVQSPQTSCDKNGHYPIPEYFMPAMPPLGLLSAIKDWLNAWRRRRALIGLLKYDDHMLDDMGYTRAELLMVSRLPIKENAYEVLQQWREARRHTG